MKYWAKQMSVNEAYKLGRQELLEIVEVDRKYRGEGIYVIQFEYGIKIGRSSNLCSRINSYEVPWNQHIRQLKVYRTQGSVRFEATIKRCLKEYKHKDSPEFLEGIPFQRVIEFIENNPGFKKTA